jgi:hypothetical protein
LSLIPLRPRDYDALRKDRSVLRIFLLFGALALCAFADALWTSNHRQDVLALGFGFPETFSPDEAQIGALPLALSRWTGRDLEARERRR